MPRSGRHEHVGRPDYTLALARTTATSATGRSDWRPGRRAQCRACAPFHRSLPAPPERDPRTAPPSRTSASCSRRCSGCARRCG